LNPADSLDEGQDVHVKEVAQAAIPAPANANGAASQHPNSPPPANGAAGAKR
jgi:hypothetical protein